MLSVPVPVLAARSYINNSNEFLRFGFSQEGDKIVLDAQKCREISSTLGRPDVKIVDAAREVRAGLIVMGAYGRNRITDYFLGSNSTSVIRTSPIAVLVAR